MMEGPLCVITDVAPASSSVSLMGLTRTPTLTRLLMELLGCCCSVIAASVESYALYKEQNAAKSCIRKKEYQRESYMTLMKGKAQHVNCKEGE